MWIDYGDAALNFDRAERMYIARNHADDYLLKVVMAGGETVAIGRYLFMADAQRTYANILDSTMDDTCGMFKIFPEDDDED